MKRNLLTALGMTVATTLLLGLAYPLLVTALAHLLFPEQANGQLILIDGQLMGSRLIGQPFSGPGYFHTRPSATGYDGSASGGTNLGPSSAQLIERVRQETARRADKILSLIVPIELVTASASGLDPHISLAAAEFQIPRVARERGHSEGRIRSLLLAQVANRQLGFLGEPRVNVLELNLLLNSTLPRATTPTTGVR